MAQRPVVLAVAVAVAVGMMVVVSEEMRYVYADLPREGAESQVLAVTAQGWVVVSEMVAGMYLRQCEGVAVLVQVQV